MADMKIDLDKIIRALESRANRDFDEFYFDKQTGEVLSADETASRDPAKFAAAESTPERFILIKPIPQQDIELLMDDFLGTLQDAEARHELEQLLLESGTFLDFKNILSEFPDAQNQWEAFHTSEMKQSANSWLKSHDVSIVTE
jgi:hypothetical protein